MARMVRFASPMTVPLVDTDRQHDMRHLLAEVKGLDTASDRADRLIERGLRDRSIGSMTALRKGILYFLVRAMDPVLQTTTLNSLTSYLDAALGSGYGDGGYSVQDVNTVLYVAHQILDNGLESGYTEVIKSE
jgi:hypothetical protein